MNIKSGVFLLLFMIVGLWVSCASKNKSIPEVSAQQEKKLPLKTMKTLSIADTVVQVYSGGGVTGQYTGYILSSNGIVKSFVKTASQQIIKQNSTQVPPDSVRILFQELYLTGIFKNPMLKVGNVTHYFIYRDPQKKFTISWVSPDDVPEKFWQWYTRFQQRCQQWLTATTNK